MKNIIALALLLGSAFAVSNAITVIPSYGMVTNYEAAKTNAADTNILGLRFTPSLNSAGLYEFSWYYEFNGLLGTEILASDVTLNGSNVLANNAQGAVANGFTPVSGFCRVSLPFQTNTLDFNFARSGVGTIVVRNIRLKIASVP